MLGGNRPTVLIKTFLTFDCFRTNWFTYLQPCPYWQLRKNRKKSSKSCSWPSWKPELLELNLFVSDKNFSRRKIMTNIIPVPGSVFSHGPFLDKNWDFCPWDNQRLSLRIVKKLRYKLLSDYKITVVFLTRRTWKVKRSLATKNCGLKDNPSRLSSGVEWDSKLLGTLSQKHPRKKDHGTIHVSPDVEAVNIRHKFLPRNTIHASHPFWWVKWIHESSANLQRKNAVQASSESQEAQNLRSKELGEGSLFKNVQNTVIPGRLNIEVLFKKLPAFNKTKGRLKLPRHEAWKHQRGLAPRWWLTGIHLEPARWCPHVKRHNFRMCFYSYITCDVKTPLPAWQWQFFRFTSESPTNSWARCSYRISIYLHQVWSPHDMIK